MGVIIPANNRTKPVCFNYEESAGKLIAETDKRDFLRSEAQTPLYEKFLAAGILFAISTNFEPVLEVAEACLTRARDQEVGLIQVHVRIWVDPHTHSNPPWPKPYFRGLDHVIFIGIDPRNSLLIDLRKLRVLGRLTPEVAADLTFWKIVIFPVLLAALGSAAGHAVLHCACVVWEGSGVLLAGESRSGKSTLCLALGQMGFGFVSDDRTLFSIMDGHLQAHGLGSCIKLRPDAAAHFGCLTRCLAVNWPNEDGATYLDAIPDFGLERVYTCEPQSVFFLEQAQGAAFSIEEITPQEAASRLEQGLIQETVEAARIRRRVIDSLVERECFLLRYGRDPQSIAWSLRNFLANHLENGRARICKPSAPLPRRDGPRWDPLRRFTDTQLSADFRLMRRHIRIETNSPLILEYTGRTLRRYVQGTATLPDFRWRVISDPKGQLEPPWPEMTAFSHRHLRFVNLGQRSFIAVDAECREAVAFVSENLVKDEAGFASIVLASLFYLCAGTLALTAVSAACVASAGKGLLLFGVPRSGKTTSCFKASGQGYEFHADQACFLEVEDGSLQAWGDFWPAAFHRETAKFLPDLVELGQPFTHHDAAYLCIDKSPSAIDEASSVAPVACIFLEREVAGPPKLVPLSARHLTQILERGIPFKDNSGPEEARRAVYSALSRLPAYRLIHANSPSAVSLFFRRLLNTHRDAECLR